MKKGCSSNRTQRLAEIELIERGVIACTTNQIQVHLDRFNYPTLPRRRPSETAEAEGTSVGLIGRFNVTEVGRIRNGIRRSCMQVSASERMKTEE